MQVCTEQGSFSVCDCIASPADAAGDALADGASGDGGSPPLPMNDAGSADAALADGAVGPGDAGKPGPDAAVDAYMGVIAEPADEASYVFDPAQVRTYNIVIAPQDLATIDADPMAEEWVPANLEFEGTTYGPFEVRYKGSQGAFRAPCTAETDGPKTGKCSIKLGFDRPDDAGRFFGLRKLNFHSMNADDAMLRERLGYALFRESHVAAPRAVHARVLVNGVFEGLFLAVEQIDGRFSRARFVEGGEGNVYKEVWPTDTDTTRYLEALETNKDEQPSVQGMLDLYAAIGQGAAAVESLVERDYTLRFIAVDRVITNDDGLFRFNCDPTSPQSPGRNKNFYWYEAAAMPKFWLIPWDLDLTFENESWVHVVVPWNATATCTCVANPQYGAQMPPSCDPLVAHFASWRTDYEVKVDALLAGPFAKPRVDAKLDSWSAQIQPHVVEAAGVKGAPDEAAWAEELTRLRAILDSARANRGYAY